MPLENNQNNVRPTLSLLDKDQLNQVHRYSVGILEKTGIKVESKTALQIFRASNAVRIDNDIVYIQEELIDHAIKQVPSNIELFDRSGRLAFNLGTQQGNETYFGVGVTNPYFQNIEDSSVELFTRKHMQHSAKLGDLLENYDMVSTIGIPSDLPADISDLYSTLDMYANTTKPLVLLISEDKNINKVFELLSFLNGDISSRPFCIPYFNPITPLVLNKSTTDKMIVSLNNKLPIIYSNYSMYGGTSPITEAGSLSLLNAELLAGLVFGQLVKEGSKMILGSLPAAFNMTTMGSYYTTTTYLLNLACAEMMSYYGIPHCGTSGSSNAWGSDLLASADLWQNHLSSVIGKIGCAPFVGGNFDSLAFSPANLVLSNHIIGEARKFAKGFSLNDETVNLNEIDRVGPGGNYFTSEQTLAHLPELASVNNIWPSLSLEAWRANGSPKAEKILAEYTMNIYSKAIKSSDENIDVIMKGEAYIAKTLK